MDRGSDRQLQVGKNLILLTLRFKTLSAQGPPRTEKIKILLLVVDRYRYSNEAERAD